MRRIVLILGMLIFLLIPAQAQDGLNLPTELYILLNEGHIERYGLGVAGVQRVSPDGTFILDFGISPDGHWIAYRTPEGLFLRNMFTEAVRQIEAESANAPQIRGQGQTIAWSPSSHALAYTTEYGGRIAFFGDNTFVDIVTPGLLNLVWSPDGLHLAAEATEGVWWIFERQGAEMALTAAIPGARGAAWVNGSRLVYAPIEGGLTLIDLAAGNQPYSIGDPAQPYHFPYVMPDGSIRVFSGEAQAARLQEISMVSGDIETTEIGNNDVDLNGVQWAPRGQLLVAFQGGALALLDPMGGGGFTLPIAGAATLGWGPTYPQAATGVQLPADGYFIALDNTSIAQVWRLPSDGSLPVTITPATHDITEFALSPDETRITYVSNGSLWAFAPGIEAPAFPIKQLGLSEGVTPRWSPDSSTIYYHDRQDVGTGIWRYNLDTTEHDRFLGDTDSAVYTNPKPAGGVGALLVTVNDSLVLVDVTSGQETPIGMQGTGKWMIGSEFLALGNSSRGALTGNGLFAYDASNLEADPQLILPVLGNLQILDYQALDGGQIRILAQNTTPGYVQIFDIGRDGSAPVFIGTAGYLHAPQLAPGGESVIGYTAPGGALIVYDVQNNTSTTIDTLPQVSGFIWQG